MKIEGIRRAIAQLESFQIKNEETSAENEDLIIPIAEFKSKLIHNENVFNRESKKVRTFN